MMENTNRNNKALWIFPNFLDSINVLPEKQRADVWRAVCEYGLGEEIDIEKLKPMQKCVIKMLIPLLKLRNTGGSLKKGDVINPMGIGGKSHKSAISFDNPIDNPIDNPLYNKNRNINKNINNNKKDDNNLITCRANTSVVSSTSMSSKGDAVSVEKEKEKSCVKKKKKDVELKSYGEFGNVLLEEEYYNRLCKENPLFLDAVEKLDTWLDTKNGEKNKGRNHRAYFKKGSWVYENLKPHSSQPMTMEQVLAEADRRIYGEL